MAARKLRWGIGAGSTFALGVVAGLFLKEAVQWLQKGARRKHAHREAEHTIAFDQNLPDALERREPAPEPGQPRFGGTGAIGFSPAVVTRPSE
jgi:hypothetical protein